MHVTDWFMPFTRVSGAANVSAGNINGEPGFPAAGDVYFNNNGFVVERYTGTAWQPFGPLFALTPPVYGSFAWINQGSATATDNGKNGVVIYDPAHNNENMRILKKSAPSQPYDLYAMMLLPGISGNFLKAGVCLRESSSGKLVNFSLQMNGTSGNIEIAVVHMNSPTSFNAQPTSAPLATWPCFLRIRDEGTGGSNKRKFYVSNDGQNWIKFYEQTPNTFITADEIGFWVNANNAVYDYLASVLHFTAV